MLSHASGWKRAASAHPPTQETESPSEWHPAIRCARSSLDQLHRERGRLARPLKTVNLRARLRFALEARPPLRDRRRTTVRAPQRDVAHKLRLARDTPRPSHRPKAVQSILTARLVPRGSFTEDRGPAALEFLRTGHRASRAPSRRPRKRRARSGGRTPASR